LQDRISLLLQVLVKGKYGLFSTRLKLPSQPLIDTYETRKNEYMETKFKEFEEKLTGDPGIQKMESQ
jgi:hypothetical protein